MQFNRKGALELSVTGVVVLIIAIVVLGSVIFFIRSFFGETQGLIGQQLASVKETLRDTIKDTGEPIVMDFGRELQLKRGRPQTVYVGIRNDFTGADKSETVCYYLQVVCLRSFSGGVNCGIDASTKDDAGKTIPAPATSAEPTIVGGLGVDGTAFTNADGSASVVSDSPWVTKMLTLWDVPNRGTDVNPVTFQVSSAAVDTYQMELRVYTAADATEKKSCSDFGAAFPNNGLELWQAKRFLVELT